MSERKRREVLQLLREFRAWHSPFGGAYPLDETGVVDAAYGAAGYIEEGQAYKDRRERERLRESYRLLDHALTLLKNDGTEGMTCYLVLLSPYIGDPGDPSIVAEWRKKSPGTAEWHDLAVKKLAGYLTFKDLYVAWPARMSAREERQMERRNSEFYALYQRIKAELRDAGRSESKANAEAVATAAIHCGYSKRRGYEIVAARTGRKAG